MGAPPGGASPGDGTTLFRVWAPRAQAVEVALAGGRTALGAAGRGVFEGVAPAAAGDDYRYVLDGGDPLPDPCSRFQPRGGARTLARRRHRPASRGPTTPGPGSTTAGLVIYELHVGTFTPEGTFEAAAARLAELRELGVTAVELMPVATFPGERGWGYDGVYTWAPHPAYGGPEALAALRRRGPRARARGDPRRRLQPRRGPASEALDAFGPYFTDRHGTPWGRAMNFDDADCGGVREWALQNAAHVAARLPHRRPAPRRRARDLRHGRAARAGRAGRPGAGRVAAAGAADRRERPQRPAHPAARRASAGTASTPSGATTSTTRCTRCSRASATATTGTSARWRTWPRPRAGPSCTTAATRSSGGGGTAPRPTTARRPSSSSTPRTTTRWATARSATGRRRSARRWPPPGSSCRPTSRCSSWARSTARTRPSSSSPTTSTRRSPRPRGTGGVPSSPPSRASTGRCPTRRRPRPSRARSCARGRASPRCAISTGGCWRCAARCPRRRRRWSSTRTPRGSPCGAAPSGARQLRRPRRGGARGGA